MDVVEIIVTVRVGQWLTIVGRTVHVNPFDLEANVVIQRFQLQHQAGTVNISLSG